MEEESPFAFSSCARKGISSSCGTKHCNQHRSGYWLGDEYENWRCVQDGSTVAENEETEEKAEHRRLGLFALDQSVQLHIRRQYFRSEFSRTEASEERVEIRFEMLLPFLEFWFREEWKILRTRRFVFSLVLRFLVERSDWEKRREWASYASSSSGSGCRYLQRLRLISFRVVAVERGREAKKEGQEDVGPGVFGEAQVVNADRGCRECCRPRKEHRSCYLHCTCLVFPLLLLCVERVFVYLFFVVCCM